MKLYTIYSINRLPDEQKREIYTRLIPKELIERFNLKQDLRDEQNRSLLNLNCLSGASIAEIELNHQFGYIDPILSGQMTDTINGQIHILLYILNDPSSPRFDIDCMPNGLPTGFGTHHRNIPAEIQAMEYGLAPGQIRSGLHLLGVAIRAFEQFVTSLGHELYFAEPLYYHNAVLFERFGFCYEKGRKLMERIQHGFSEHGDLRTRLDNSTPFRRPDAMKSIRLRSWAIHDNILDEPFTDVTMYKWVGKSGCLNTSEECAW